jgi:hypothetical protein
MIIDDETAVFMHRPSTWARRAAPDHRLRGVILVGPDTYEITFTGQASRTVRAEFDDCTVIVGPNTTTLRAQLPGQGTLWGLVQRIIGLGLEVVDLHLVTPPPAPSQERTQTVTVISPRNDLASDADLK